MTAPDKILVNLASNDDSCCPVEDASNQPEDFGKYFSAESATSYTRTDLAQAAVAAAYEAAAQVLSLNAWSHLGTDCYSAGMDAGARHQSKVDYDAIRALATPDQIAALAAKVDASQAPNPAANGGRCQSGTITLPRAEVEALMEAARAAWDEACANHEKAPPIKYLAPYGGLVRLHTALAALQERMK